MKRKQNNKEQLEKRRKAKAMRVKLKEIKKGMRKNLLSRERDAYKAWQMYSKEYTNMNKHQKWALFCKNLPDEARFLCVQWRIHEKSV